MIEFVSVLPTKPSTLSAPIPFPSQRHLTPTSSSPIPGPLHSCQPAIRATTTRGEPQQAAPVTDPTRTCAQPDRAPTAKASTASFRCGCVTGCRRAHGTAANACASPSALRAGGREPASVHALPTAGQVATIGPTESGEAITEIFGKFTTPKQTWQRAHVDDDEDYEFTT
ncbi:hypothetical protein V495_02083 [Pseudogymnoascus sp. VKM F-4514 (FW-929)]|nr:hypothetical protein V495_02083 [Pseudogymnoascus sp. VKM F-4514 (FW-929)]KFY56234.1 hypothetical protein V497_06425 [Pseudogymnoascus sp. VKM F-4516 (FW-969)]